MEARSCSPHAPCPLAHLKFQLWHHWEQRWHWELNDIARVCNNAMEEVYHAASERLGAARAHVLLCHVVQTVRNRTRRPATHDGSSDVTDATAEGIRATLRELSLHISAIHGDDTSDGEDAEGSDDCMLLNHMLHAAVQRGGNGVDTPAEATAAIAQLVDAGVAAEAALVIDRGTAWARELSNTIREACAAPWLLRALLCASAPRWSEDAWVAQIALTCVGIWTHPLYPSPNFAPWMVGILLEPIHGRCPSQRSIVNALRALWMSSQSLAADMLLAAAAPYYSLAYANIFPKQYECDARLAIDPDDDLWLWRRLATYALLAMPPTNPLTWVRTGFLAPGEVLQADVARRLLGVTKDLATRVVAYAAAFREAAWGRRGPALGGWARARR